MRCGGRNSARRGGSAAQYRKRGIPSVLLVGAAEHRAARRLRRSKITELRVTLAALRQRPRFPAKTEHPRKSAQTAGFCCRKAHLGYLSDNYTSEKGCLSIPQTQNIPVRGFRGAFFVPEARAGRGRYTRQRSAYRNKRKRAAADMPHRGVEKVYAPNAPGCAKIRFPYHKHRTRRIGGTKFLPRKRGYNICEQPRFSR